MKTENYYEGYIKDPLLVPIRKKEGLLHISEYLDVCKQIKEYPTPISDCDSTFDALLERRNQLNESKRKKS